MWIRLDIRNKTAKLTNMAKHGISINIEAFPSFRTGFLIFQDVTKLDF